LTRHFRKEKSRKIEKLLKYNLVNLSDKTVIIINKSDGKNTQNWTRTAVYRFWLSITFGENKNEKSSGFLTKI
jgi:hypothetical protein